MEVLYEARFARDLRKVGDKQLLQRVQEVITLVKAADDLTDIRNLKKIQGYDSYYSIRLEDY